MFYSTLGHSRLRTWRRRWARGWRRKRCRRLRLVRCVAQIVPHFPGTPITDRAPAQFGFANGMDANSLSPFLICIIHPNVTLRLISHEFRDNALAIFAGRIIVGQMNAVFVSHEFTRRTKNRKFIVWHVERALSVPVALEMQARDCPDKATEHGSRDPLKNLAPLKGSSEAVAVFFFGIGTETRVCSYDSDGRSAPAFPPTGLSSCCMCVRNPGLETDQGFVSGSHSHRAK